MHKQAWNKAKGFINLAYQLNKSEQQIFSLYQQEPLRILFPSLHEIGIQGGILINTTGGIAGGDEHVINIDVGQGTKALLTTQAAEKIYSSPLLTANLNITINIENKGWFEWLPQETILFNQARLKRNIRLSLTSTSQIMAGEILIFGRVERGETFQNGLLQDKWSVYWNNELIWQDILFLKENSILEALNHFAGFNNAKAYATFVYVGTQAPYYIDYVRELLECSKIHSSATLMTPNLIVVRWLSYNPLQLRKEYANFWRLLRSQIIALPAVLPRTWFF